MRKARAHDPCATFVRNLRAQPSCATLPRTTPRVPIDAHVRVLHRLVAPSSPRRQTNLCVNVVCVSVCLCVCVSACLCVCVSVVCCPCTGVAIPRHRIHLQSSWISTSALRPRSLRQLPTRARSVQRRRRTHRRGCFGDGTACVCRCDRHAGRYIIVIIVTSAIDSKATAATATADSTRPEGPATQAITVDQPCQWPALNC